MQAFHIVDPEIHLLIYKRTNRSRLLYHLWQILTNHSFRPFHSPVDDHNLYVPVPSTRPVISLSLLRSPTQQPRLLMRRITGPHPEAKVTCWQKVSHRELSQERERRGSFMSLASLWKCWKIVMKHDPLEYHLQSRAQTA